jgi:hypothetical protein
MSAFNQARAVEAKGLAILLPMIEERAYDGRFVLCNKGPLSKRLQETVGDVIFNSDKDRVWTVEIKIEQTFTGNLFLETWSNKNLDDRLNHAEHGSNPGWLIKLVSDLLFYYFIDTDDLFIIDVFKLQQWAFGSGQTPGRIYQYREVKQGKFNQKNDTWGRLVPLQIIEKNVGFRLIHPLALQGSLMEKAS